MTASNPLHTEPIGRPLYPAPTPQEPRVAAPASPTDVDAGPLNGTEQASAGPEWVDMAAGQAVREATVTPPPTAHRPLELDELAFQRAEFEAEQRALAFAGEPGPLYKSFYRIVQTVVLGIFASGTGMAAYILIRR